MEEPERHQPPTDIGLDEADNLLDQGRVYYSQGDFKEALSCLHLAHDRYRVDGERRQIAEVANDLGVVYTVLRRWGEAEKWLDQAQRMFGEIGDLGRRGADAGQPRQHVPRQGRMEGSGRQSETVRGPLSRRQ